MDSKQITIAITVYNRRQYIKQAIASALDQTASVRVMVVEDCGPDPTLEDFVKAEFGPRVEYFRNPKRRGLFGNWNACLELCQTEWISILHDDDYLAPRFAEAMLELEKAAPGRALYFGITLGVDEHGAPRPELAAASFSGKWVERGLKDVLYGPYWFPGHLFRVLTGKRLGMFRETSHFCGDWEMWAKLMADGGGAQINEVLAFMRHHGGLEKGTNKIIREGRQYPLTYVQHKRVLALLPASSRLKFDRTHLVKRCPVPTRDLVHFGSSFRPRLLRYHAKLLLIPAPPHWRYGVFQWMTRLFGAGFIRTVSWLWNRWSALKKDQPRENSNARP
jgi:glycosyltransferase involved in cell wall biosynthesis